MKMITINPNNEPYYSEDFIKGFECGTQRQLESDKKDRPQGEWIRISDDWVDGPCGARYFPIRCSVCGYSTYDDDATKFCPNCGAHMKGADDDDNNE